MDGHVERHVDPGTEFVVSFIPFLIFCLSWYRLAFGKLARAQTQCPGLRWIHGDKGRQNRELEGEGGRGIKKGEGRAENKNCLKQDKNYVEELHFDLVDES